MKKYYTEEDEEINVYYLLNEYADCHPEFKCKFLESLTKSFEKTGEISADQLEILRTIARENEINYTDDTFY